MATLTLIGVVVMMLTISPWLTVVALVTVPLSVVAMKKIGGRARPRYMAQWGHTGALNSQVEEAFTGHAIVKSFGRRREVAEAFDETNEQLFEASFGAQFMVSLHNDERGECHLRRTQHQYPTAQGMQLR